ncbi:MAG: hypothetical protein QOH93_1985 [Chloroflexia bacterium]|jgi:hypothetical protein|nr:hypothetical protein [Chloroflexia bacterium]
MSGVTVPAGKLKVGEACVIVVHMSKFGKRVLATGWRVPVALLCTFLLAACNLSVNDNGPRRSLLTPTPLGTLGPGLDEDPPELNITAGPGTTVPTRPPRPTRTPLPTSTATRLPTKTPTVTNTPGTPSPTRTPTNTLTPFATPTAFATFTPLPVIPTVTPHPFWSPTPRPTRAPTSIPTPTTVPTSAPADTPTETPTPQVVAPPATDIPVTPETPTPEPPSLPTDTPAPPLGVILTPPAP